MGDFSSAMDGIIIICGLYILYAAITMRAGGEIQSVLMSKNLDVKKCKDLEGYKRYLFPRALVMGVVTVLFGAAGMVNAYVMELGMIYSGLLVLVLAVLVWYFVDYRRGIQRFWGV